MSFRRVGLSLGVAGCAAASIAAPPLGEIPKPATGLERLGIADAVLDQQLTGKGVRISVLSEAADGEHRDFEGVDLRQWRFGSDPTSTPIERAEPLLVSEDWHGTHIASILAAGCGLQNRGVACGATVDVHDFGVYGDFIPLNWDASVGEVEADFLQRLIRGFDHAANKGASIANLSFNLESPSLTLGSPVGPKPKVADRINDLAIPAGAFFRRRHELRENGLIAFGDLKTWDYLSRIGTHHDNPSSLVVGLLLPATYEWQEMAQAMARFQSADGVILIAESNNRFEGHSGLLNTIPTQFDVVRANQWLSIVHVRDDGAGGFETPLNGCGIEAAQYCLAVYSPEILAAAPDGSSHIASGHSMAVPMVSGLIALLLENARRTDSGFSASQALCLVRASARRDFSGYDPNIHGLGVLDAHRALAGVERLTAGSSVGLCD